MLLWRGAITVTSFTDYAFDKFVTATKSKMQILTIKGSYHLYITRTKSKLLQNAGNGMKVSENWKFTIPRQLFKK